MYVFRIVAIALIAAFAAGMMYIPEVMAPILTWSAAVLGIMVVIGLICFFWWPIQIRLPTINKIHAVHPTGHIKDLDVAVEESGAMHLVKTASDEDVYYVYYQTAAHVGAEWSTPERLGLGLKAYLQVTDEVLNVVAVDKKRVAIYRAEKEQKTWRHIGSFFEDYNQQDHALIFDEKTGFLNLVLVYSMRPGEVSRGEDRSLFFTRSGDLGNSWTDLLPVVKGIPSVSDEYITCSASGNDIAVMWQVEGRANGPIIGRSGNRDGVQTVHRRKEGVIKGVESKDGGQSWSEITPLVTNSKIGRISLVHTTEGLCLLGRRSLYPHKLLCWVYREGEFELERTLGRFESGFSSSGEGDMIAYRTYKYYRQSPFKFLLQNFTKGNGIIHNDLMLVSLKGKGRRLLTPRRTEAYRNHSRARRLAIRKVDKTVYVFWHGRKNVKSIRLAENELPGISYTTISR